MVVLPSARPSRTDDCVCFGGLSVNVCVFMSGHARILKGHVLLLCVCVGVGDLQFRSVCLTPFKARPFLL